MSFNKIQNPLLDRIPLFKTPVEICNAMRFNPLLNVEKSELSFMERDAILSGNKVLLSPTKKTIKAGMTWYGMLTRGLENRNPILVENRKKYFEALSQNNYQEIPKFPIPGMSVNVLKGPTGTGKSVTIQRFCSCLPQVIEHGKNEAAGWIYHKQLVYLHLNMSHDGSRGGFLTSILHEIDTALSTQYSITIPKQYKTVDKLAVGTVGRLIAHHTGILFVDESQLRNLVKSGQAELMQLFLLQLMNCGIPIVISGNERALDWLTYSQDLSRITLTEITHLHPVGALNEPNWENDWKALCDLGIMKFYVLIDPIQDIDACSKLLFECSGGIARLALTLWTQAQRDCLLQQKEHISLEDIQRAYESFSYQEIRPLADGFRHKSASTLSIFPDVNTEFYKAFWNTHDSQQSKPQMLKPQIGEIEKRELVTKTMSEKTKFNSDKTRKINRLNKSNALKANLDEDDLRNSQVLNEHLKNLELLKMKST